MRVVLSWKNSFLIQIKSLPKKILIGGRMLHTSAAITTNQFNFQVEKKKKLIMGNA